MRRLTRLLPLLALAAGVSSCATIPPERREAEWLGILPAPSPRAVYASLEITSSGGLLRSLAGIAGLEAIRFEKVLEDTNRVYVRLEYEAPGRPRFSLIALGDFKPTAVALRLNLDNRWERVLLDPAAVGGSKCSCRSLRTYWRNPGAGLAVAAPLRGVVFVSTAGPGPYPEGVAEMLERRQAPGPTPIPPAAVHGMQAAELFLFLPDPMGLAAAASPGSEVSGREAPPVPILGMQALPIEQAWLRAEAEAGGYRLEVALRLAEAGNPAAVEKLLRLALILWMRRTGIEDPAEQLRALRITVDQGLARIESLRLSEEQLLALLASFLPASLPSGEEEI